MGIEQIGPEWRPSLESLQPIGYLSICGESVFVTGYSTYIRRFGQGSGCFDHIAFTTPRGRVERVPLNKPEIEWFKDLLEERGFPQYFDKEPDTQTLQWHKQLYPEA